MSGEAVRFELVPDEGNYRAKRERKSVGWHKAHQRRKQQRRREAQAWLARYKAEHPCICGEKDPVALDLHHKGEIKTRDMSRMRTLGQILRELPYCVVLCANCHRKLHAGAGLSEGQLGLEL
jgi:hypothetical protein